MAYVSGIKAVTMGGAIRMPIGEQIRGRLLNVIGDAIDGLPKVDKKGGYEIHADPPKFDQLSTETEVLFTGIKVIDLLEPYPKGGKIGLFGGAGVGKTVLLWNSSTILQKNMPVYRYLPVWVKEPVKEMTCCVK